MSVVARLPSGRSSIPILHQVGAAGRCAPSRSEVPLRAALRTSGATARRKVGAAAGAPAAAMHKPEKRPPAAPSVASPSHDARSKEGALLRTQNARALALCKAKKVNVLILHSRIYYLCIA